MPWLSLLSPTVIKWAAIFGVVIGVYFWYVHTENELETLRNNNILLQNSVDTQQKVIQHLKEDDALKEQLGIELEKKIAELETKTKSLTDTLYRENQKKKSLEELATKKTTLVQHLVNKATGEVLNCFETISNGGDCK